MITSRSRTRGVAGIERLRVGAAHHRAGIG